MIWSFIFGFLILLILEWFFNDRNTPELGVGSDFRTYYSVFDLFIFNFSET